MNQTMKPRMDSIESRFAMHDQAQTVSATYDDIFECREGNWKIMRHKVTMHHFTPSPGVTLSPPV